MSCLIMLSTHKKIGVNDVKQYYVIEQDPKEAQQQFNRRARKIGDGQSMLKLVLEGSTEFKPELKNGFDASKVQALNDYLAKNYTAEEISALKSPRFFYEVEFDKPG